MRPGASRDNDCALQIKNLDKATDSGLYQCQTSEEPPQSQYYQLNVVGKCGGDEDADNASTQVIKATNLNINININPDGPSHATPRHATRPPTQSRKWPSWARPTWPSSWALQST